MAVRPSQIRAVRVLLAFACGMLLTLATPPLLARADYRGPDENPDQAFGPLAGGTNYSASVSGEDQDWFYYYVKNDGATLHWTVTNQTTLLNCLPLGIYYCNIYATLIGPDGKQLGGEGSSAGTSGVGPDSTQNIDWKYDQPGKYYIAIVGDGDTLNYQFSVTPASALTSTPPSGVGRSGRSGSQALHLSAHRSGRDVNVTLETPSAGAHVIGKLILPTGAVAGRESVRHLPKGRVQLPIPLRKKAWAMLKSKKHLTLTLNVTVSLPGGHLIQGTRAVSLRYH
jgi:hypothetical protein